LKEMTKLHLNPPLDFSRKALIKRAVTSAS
jgi:hypothetical protein